MFGYWGNSWADDGGSGGKCYRHKYDEKLLVGVHTYWQCTDCEHNINFNEISQTDTILSRISMHKLPWEKK